MAPSGEGGEAGETFEGGQAGEGGTTLTSGGASSNAGIAGADDFQGSAGGGAVGADGGTAGALGSNGGAANGGAANGGAANGGAPTVDEPGAGGAPPVPVSICGTGMWFAGEGICGVCPTTTQVFELACADYPSGQILISANQLQFALVRLPDGVEPHEAGPVGVSVAYVTPDASLASQVRLSTSGWSVDLRASPNPPGSVIIPPFTAADVCGDVFKSLEPVRFDRVDLGTYVKACP